MSVCDRCQGDRGGCRCKELDRIAELEVEMAELTRDADKLRSLLKDIHGDITMLDKGVPVQADTWDRLCEACG